MLRILRADLHRLFRSPVLYITPAIMIGTLIMALFGERSEKSVADWGEILSSTTDMMSVIVLAAAGVVMIFLWSQENKNGYIKNIAGNAAGRHIPTISKLLTGSLVILIYAVFSILFVLGGHLINGYTITGAPDSKTVIFFLIWILVGIGATALMLLLFEAFKSPALCYIAALLFWTKAVEELIINVFYIVFKIDTIGRWTMLYGMYWENSGQLENLIRTLIYGAVFGTAAVIISKKSDVR